MNLKKLLSLMLALALLLAVAACGKDGGEADTDGDADVSGADGLDYSQGFDDNGFFEGVKASEIVELPDYKGIVLPTEPDKEEVQAVIDRILAGNVKYEHVTDRAVQDGDTLNIDYVGSVDGVEFAGGSTGGRGADVTVGVTQYIDDFIEQLIGHMPGENFDIEVTFPDPYENNPDLAGAEAVFNITINYIQGEAIERELNDELAVEIGYENLEAMLADIDSYVLETARYDAVEELLNSAVCEEIPQSAMNTAAGIILLTYRDMYGVDIDSLLTESFGVSTVEEFAQSVESALEPDMRFYLAVQAIAEIEGLEVSMDDIAAAGAESSIDIYGEPYVRFNLLSVVVRDFIIENAVGGETE